MHVILRDPTQKAEESVVCVERDTQTAIILRSDFDRLDDLVGIARSMKVPKVYLLIDAASAKEFEDAGWTRSDRIVMEKK